MRNLKLENAIASYDTSNKTGLQLPFALHFFDQIIYFIHKFAKIRGCSETVFGEITAPSVKITFNKCPVINYKLKLEINVATSIKNPLFNFSRTYHSKKVLVTDKIDCKVIGIEPHKERIRRNQNPQKPKTVPQVQIHRPPFCCSIIAFKFLLLNFSATYFMLLKFCHSVLNC